MRKNIYLLLGVILLYLISSLILSGIYGPSYGFMQGENRWEPDGSGGWVKHGTPTDPAPAEPSVQVPDSVRYIPIFLPGALLVLFLFTPLGKKLESPKQPEPTDGLDDQNNVAPPEDTPPAT
jgi:hypothetical protein